ncbi:SURF1 family protein, partial [Ancylostoma duodenale]
LYLKEEIERSSRYSFGCYFRNCSDSKLLSLQLERRSKEKGQDRQKTGREGNGGGGNKRFSAGSIAMLIIPATTFCLGCWQTYRLRWKLDLIERLKQRLDEPAVDFPLDDVSKLDSMEYRRVRVTGEFLHDKEFHIAPRGRFDPGYKEKSSGSLLSSDDLSSHGAHIITPFRLSKSNVVVMINRGWVPASKVSPNSRTASQPKGEVTIEAVVRKSEKRPQFVGENVPERGLWFYKDFDQMALQYNTDPIYLEAVYESTVPGGPIGGQSNVNKFILTIGPIQMIQPTNNSIHMGLAKLFKQGKTFR